MSFQKKQRGDDISEEVPAQTRAKILLSWLKDQGVDMSNLELRESVGGGLGLFAVHGMSVGTDIASLPASAILDPEEALCSSSIAQAALQCGASAPFAFWLSLAEGRRNPLHPWHAYLASLPDEAPDPLAWNKTELGLLQGTPLEAQVAMQHQLLHQEFTRVAKRVAPHISFDDIVRARGHHLSRSFPNELCAAAKSTSRIAISIEQGGSGSARVSILEAAPLETDSLACSTCSESAGSEPGSKKPDASGVWDRVWKTHWNACQVSLDGKSCSGHSLDSPKSHVAAAGASDPPLTNLRAEETNLAGHLGCMLPLFDMMEHRPKHFVAWQAGGGSVRFVCRTPVKAGEQLYNNYGPRSNSELLFVYGFALENNPMDTVEGLFVGCRPDLDADLASRRRSALQEAGVNFSIMSEGTLKIGPFSLSLPSSGSEVCYEPPQTPQKPHTLPSGEADSSDKRLASDKRNKCETREECITSEKCVTSENVFHSDQSVSSNQSDSFGSKGCQSIEDEADGEQQGVIPTKLLRALQVIGLESAADELVLTIDEIDLLRATLKSRLDAIEATEEAANQCMQHSNLGSTSSVAHASSSSGTHAICHVVTHTNTPTKTEARVHYARLYRQGQRALLLAALDETAELVAEEVEAEEVWEEDASDESNKRGAA